MRKTMIENFRRVDYIPLQSYVSNVVTSGNEMFYGEDALLLAHMLEQVTRKFQGDIPNMVKKMHDMGITDMKDGVRLEFSMDIYRRIVE